MNEHPELDAELKALNADVERAVKARKDWMDAHMADYARWPIGTELVWLKDGSTFGTISKYYRFYADRDLRYDKSMGIDYEVHIGGNSYDNTSRHLGTFYFGTREEYAQRLRGELARVAPALPPAAEPARIRNNVEALPCPTCGHEIPKGQWHNLPPAVECSEDSELADLLALHNAGSVAELNAYIGALEAATQDIAWLESVMRRGVDGCEIYLAGLRHGPTLGAIAFQVESQPARFAVQQAPTLLAAIHAARAAAPSGETK